MKIIAQQIRIGRKNILFYQKSENFRFRSYRKMIPAITEYQDEKKNVKNRHIQILKVWLIFKGRSVNSKQIIFYFRPNFHLILMGFSPHEPYENLTKATPILRIIRVKIISYLVILLCPHLPKGSFIHFHLSTYCSHIMQHLQST